MGWVSCLGDGVYFVQGSAVNWILVTEGDDVTVIDAGYPGDAAALLASLCDIGKRPESIRAILVTHGHIDHIGGIPALLRKAPGAVVLTSSTEAAHVRREYLQQASPLQVAARVWRPSVARWSAHVVRAGGLSTPRIPQVTGFNGDAALDVPGRPVPVPTPGHTSGHTSYLLAGGRILATGDALVTGHPLLRREGPQQLPAMFHHDRLEASATARGLCSTGAETLLPGHGPVWSGSMGAAPWAVHNPR